MSLEAPKKENRETLALNGKQDFAEPSSPEFADDALALKFTLEHGEDLRYTAEWGRWSVWNGSVWKVDRTRDVYDRARRVCRRESARCEDPRHAPRIASAQTVAAVERLAQADRRHAATIEQWDSDSWLLNTPAGVVDLRSGNLREARRDDYMTKTTTVAPNGNCPMWLSFLDWVTLGDRELQGFMQRMCGYALTGSTEEHALFFVFGHGGNGKSKFLEAICGLMGDYARTAPIEVFVDSNNQKHPTELAGLQGARLVTAIETEEGRRWAESKLKALTGGDKIAARFMRQDFFEFTPQFKPIIAGNHKPSLRTVDEAIRRRFHLLPFEVTISASERDPKLGEKLRAEWPGILQWAIDGCIAWQKEGLNPPARVKQATEDYLAEEDCLARWIEECTEEKAAAWSSSSDLFFSWTVWAKANGEIPGTPKRFSGNLDARGYERSRKNKARGFQGIRLLRRLVTDGDTSERYLRIARACDGDKGAMCHNASLDAAVGEETLVAVGGELIV